MSSRYGNEALGSFSISYGIPNSTLEIMFSSSLSDGNYPSDGSFSFTNVMKVGSGQTACYNDSTNQSSTVACDTFMNTKGDLKTRTFSITLDGSGKYSNDFGFASTLSDVEYYLELSILPGKA